jgi:hydrogenase expression/formation protein HypE
MSEKILLGHGSGGRLMHQLVREHFAGVFGMHSLADAAVLDPELLGTHRLAVTTDSYVVSPLFFPGGSIGELAVNGTVNDLAMVGARPLALTAGFIIEEGFALADLKRIVAAMAAAARTAGVAIVAGDTKVVDKGKGDGIFINTAGIGAVPRDRLLGPSQIRPGDKVILSGPMGSHGVAVMAERNGLSFDPPVETDSAALNGLVEAMFATGHAVRMMRDPTRGGVATTLKEIALESGLTMHLDESRLPIPGGVQGACELLGLDPLFIANEGILIAIVAPEAAEPVLAAMRRHRHGTAAVVVAEVKAAEPGRQGMVLMKTAIGGTRIIDMLAGEQLPRIC